MLTCVYIHIYKHFFTTLTNTCHSNTPATYIYIYIYRWLFCCTAHPFWVRLQGKEERKWRLAYMLEQPTDPARGQLKWSWSYTVLGLGLMKINKILRGREELAWFSCRYSNRNNNWNVRFFLVSQPLLPLFFSLFLQLLCLPLFLHTQPNSLP